MATATRPTRPPRQRKTFRAYRINLQDIGSREEFLKTFLAHLDNPEFAIGTRKKIKGLLKQSTGSGSNKRIESLGGVTMQDILLLTDAEKRRLNPSTLRRLQEAFRAFGIDF